MFATGKPVDYLVDPDSTKPAGTPFSMHSRASSFFTLHALNKPKRPQQRWSGDPWGP